MWIRALSLSDRAAIHALFSQSYQERWHWSDAMLCDSLAAPYQHFLGLFVDERLVGVLHAQLLFDTGEILNIGILPAEQNKGYGAYLLKEGLKQLEEQGMMHCLLEVRASNQAAITVYERLGFTRINERKQYYADTQEAAYIYQWKGQTNDENISH